MFCATCLFMWWETSRATTCPACRTVCQNVPVRDRSSGLISLVSAPPEEVVEPFDMNRFAVVMEENAIEAEERAREAMAIDYSWPGTSMNPMDLTEAWN